MNEQKPARRTRRLTIILFGIFFLYLAIMEGEVNGNSVLLFLVGICAIVYGIISSSVIRNRLLRYLHIVEIDLDHKEQKK